jgi:(S)-ureidoglycine aminohydrolase
MRRVLVTNDADVDYMPGTDGAWGTSRFVDPADMRHDMAVTIVTFQPGGVPFLETHVMEHGLYVLEGKAVYNLNNDWVEVEAGDFMWLRVLPRRRVTQVVRSAATFVQRDVNRHPGFNRQQTIRTAVVTRRPIPQVNASALPAPMSRSAQSLHR